MKGKLKIANDKASKKNFEDACTFAEVEVKETVAFGETDLIEINFKKASQLFELGATFERLQSKKSNV